MEDGEIENKGHKVWKKMGSAAEWKCNKGTENKYGPGGRQQKKRKKKGKETKIKRSEKETR